MVLSLELPVRHRLNGITDPLHAYEKRFGALPAWFDDLSPAEARQLARQAVTRGAPLTPADHFS